MRRHLAILVLVGVAAACGAPDVIGSGGDPAPTTTIDLDQPVDSDGDEPIAEPGPVGSIPEPRPPIDGSVDGEVWVTGADVRVMESFPVQIMLDVTGDKPTPCHEIFWTVEDDGEVIEIEMISQVANEQNCAQVIEPFTIAVPLGSWTEESREIRLNGEVVGSFET
jgi:hypothetical protein